VFAAAWAASWGAAVEAAVEGGGGRAGVIVSDVVELSSKGTGMRSGM
jgi:hypothetical protein